jgi:hypothetical protein
MWLEIIIDKIAVSIFLYLISKRANVFYLFLEKGLFWGEGAHITVHS